MNLESYLLIVKKIKIIIDFLVLQIILLQFRGYEY